MVDSDDDFELELKQGFLLEATHLLDQAEQAFLNFETQHDDPEVMDLLFRMAHNLKGTSRGVGFGEMAEFTHELEDLLLKLKNKEVEPNGTVVDVLLDCNDHLREMVSGLKENLEATFDSSELISRLKQASAGAPETPSQKTDEGIPHDQDLSIEEGSLPDLQADTPAAESQAVVEPELPEVEASPEPMAEEVQAAEEHPVSEAPAPKTEQKAKTPKKAEIEESIRVPLSRIEQLNNFVGEMVIMHSVVSQQATNSNRGELLKAISQMAKITKEIQELSMGFRMLPIQGTFSKMQRIVRDTSKMLGKEVKLHLAGEKTEVDKTIIEQINDPLVHIVRNAVDHGLEETDDREPAGKPRVGNVWLSARHESSFLVIEVKDDGKGINPEILVNKAIEKGILKAGTQLPAEKAYQLLFHPGFSTKNEVSEVSGRGVGLDVVKTNIENLSGEIRIDSTMGEGSTFRVILPLTLAIIDGMVTRVGKERYVVPVTQVQETVRTQAENIETITGKGEVFNLRGETIPLIRLDQALKRSADEEKEALKNSIAIISSRESKPYAVIVDDIIRQQQVVIKQLGKEVRDQQGFTGSAILGDGQPAVILDLHELTSRKGVAS